MMTRTRLPHGYNTLTIPSTSLSMSYLTKGSDWQGNKLVVGKKGIRKHNLASLYEFQRVICSLLMLSAFQAKVIKCKKVESCSAHVKSRMIRHFFNRLVFLLII